MVEIRCSCGRLILKKVGGSVHILTPSSLGGGKVSIVCPRCKKVTEFFIKDSCGQTQDDQVALAIRKMSILKSNVEDLLSTLVSM